MVPGEEETQTHTALRVLMEQERQLSSEPEEMQICVKRKIENSWIHQDDRTNNSSKAKGRERYPHMVTS